MTGAVRQPDWPLGLAWMAHALSRDLQRASRVAGGPEALWSGGAAQMAAWLRQGADDARRAVQARDAFKAGPARDALARRGITHVPMTSDRYPARLRPIFDPPFGLFGTGAVAAALHAAEQAPVIAIVGSRRPTGAGRRLASEIAAGLVERGAVVVSGLARGIDGAVHEGALEAGGITLAVLGSAVDRVHPRRHQGLAERIAVDGAVLSEYWPGTGAAPWRFPARNRIVAGLADAVLVVEAAGRSGALITADFAMEAGRPVLAVPGWPGAEMSAGANALLRSGAALCEGVDDVVAEVPGRAWVQAAPRAAATGDAAEVLAQVAREAMGVDTIARATGLTHAEVAVALAALEIEGRVAREQGGVFRAVAAPRGPARGG